MKESEPDMRAGRHGGQGHQPDINLRIRADAAGLRAEDYESDHVLLQDVGGAMHGHADCGSLMRAGLVEIQPLAYIRGRNIAKRLVIIDEAQNLTPLEVKTVITRVGLGTKVVLTGDPWQIDNPYVDRNSNGFVYLVNRFRGEALAAYVELRKGERSILAELAANLL